MVLAVPSDGPMPLQPPEYYVDAAREVLLQYPQTGQCLCNLASFVAPGKSDELAVPSDGPMPLQPGAECPRATQLHVLQYPQTTQPLSSHDQRSYAVLRPLLQ